MQLLISQKRFSQDSQIYESCKLNSPNKLFKLVSYKPDRVSYFIFFEKVNLLLNNNHSRSTDVNENWLNEVWFSATNQQYNADLVICLIFQSKIGRNNFNSIASLALRLKFAV